MRGKFITFEGGEGAGKSTHVKTLAAQLKEAGIDVITTREPGGAPGAEEIRKLLVEGDTGKWDSLTEVLLHYAARQEHLEKTVLPALDKGSWVISDRFADSTFAYQGYGHQLGREAIQPIHDAVVGKTEPDLTLILDLDPEIGLARTLARTGHRNGAEDRYERMDIEFHQRLRTGFLDIAAANPGRCVIIEASQDIETVANEIWYALETRLNLK